MTRPGDQGAAVPTARRIGRVNWIGLWTLFWRDVLRDLDIWKITIAAPAMQAVLYALIFRLALGEASLTMGGLDFTDFLVPGLVAYVLLERGFEATAFSLVYDKLERMIEDVITAPLTPAETAIGYGLSAACVATVTGAAAWLALLPFLQAVPAAPAALIVFAFGGGLMMGLLGVVGGLWAYKWDHISAVQTFIVVPALFMSGVFFSLDQLPEEVRGVAELNPLYYAIDGVRYGLTGHFGVDPRQGIAVVAAVDAALWLVCWRLFAVGYKLKS